MTTSEIVLKSADDYKTAIDDRWWVLSVGQAKYADHIKPEQLVPIKLDGEVIGYVYRRSMEEIAEWDKKNPGLYDKQRNCYRTEETEKKELSSYGLEGLLSDG